MKRYTFQVTLHEGNDEFWEQDPSDHDVMAMLVDALEQYGILVQRPGGYAHATDTVMLVKMEEVES